MSKNYMKVKELYDNEIWKISRVRDAVITEEHPNRWITAEEFEQITGEQF